MATIGVLTYTLPHGLKIKGHANGIVNLISNNNNSNISIRHINNSSNNQIANSGMKSKPIIGDLPSDQNSHQNNFEQIQMIKSDLLAMRRKQKCMPLNDSTMDNIQSLPHAKRPRITNVPNESKTVVGGTTLAVKKVTSQPQAVARRNARERNRVKQVNNGFAALREHIPEEVAVAFEAGGSGRGTNKKLSKVETLRMAVEYIRSLERLLGLDPAERTREDDINPSEMKEDSSIESAVVPSDDTMTVIKTEECSSPIDDLYFDSSCDQDESTMYYTDGLPDITTINGQQYLRIPGTNTYQLVTVDMFENEENIQPIPGADYNNMQVEQDIVNRLPSPLASNKFQQATLPEIVPSGRVITTISPSSTSNIGQSREFYTSTPNVEFLQHDRDLGTLSISKNGNIVTTAQIFEATTVTTDASSVLIRKFVESSQLYDAVVPTKAQIKEESIVMEATNLNEDVPLETIDWWDAHRSNEAITS